MPPQLAPHEVPSHADSPPLRFRRRTRLAVVGLAGLAVALSTLALFVAFIVVSPEHGEDGPRVPQFLVAVLSWACACVGLTLSRGNPDLSLLALAGCAALNAGWQVATCPPFTDLVCEVWLPALLPPLVLAAVLVGLGFRWRRAQRRVRPPPRGTGG